MSVLNHITLPAVRLLWPLFLGGLLFGLPSLPPAAAPSDYPPEYIREYPPEYTHQLEERIRREIAALHQAQKAALAKMLVAPRPRLPHSPAGPVHIMLLFVDHWEPSDMSGQNPWFSPGWEAEASRLADYWRNNYYQMARKHRDADGRMPQHTWFTFQLAIGALDRIAQCAALGLGEVEVHLHHGTDDDSFNDNRVEFKNKMRAQLTALQERGACLSAELLPQDHFGFIHGDWALDNSRLEFGSRVHCGVNNELHLLRSLNCFSDFTFPSGLSMQPPWFNKIYASRDDQDAPKSYGNLSLMRELQALGLPPSAEEFMIFEGPGQDGLQANIDNMFAPTLEMMGYWVSFNVHIPGCDNWIFVKLMTHSAQAFYAGSRGVDNLVGSVADQFYADIEKTYNDGVEFKLHYVTAREAYNIARAAIDGRAGDPGKYRDYVIPRPVNTRFYCSAPYRLLSYDPVKLQADLNIKSLPPRDLVLWANNLPAPFRVLEADTPGAFRLSDIQPTSATTANRLVLLDPTPSRYYRISKRPLSTRRTWRLYH